MRAVILAGGKGTRLRPLTTNLPKPIVPVGDRTIMEILVQQLVWCGCKHITVAVGHLAQLMMAYFGDGERWRVKIDYSLEDRPLSTIGPLKLIEDLPDQFLVMNGDVLTDLNFADLYQTHISSGCLATVATFEREVRIDFGVMKYETNKRKIIGFEEKPVEKFSVSMGVYAFSRKILDLVPEDTAFGFDHLMLTLIERNLDARVYPYSGYWMDIGRPDDYEQVNIEFDAMKDKLLPKGSESPPEEARER